MVEDESQNAMQTSDNPLTTPQPPQSIAGDMLQTLYPIPARITS